MTTPAPATPMAAVLEEKLRAEFSPLHFEIENESHKHHSGKGAESHFRVLMVAEGFEGLQRIERQRRVFGRVEAEMKRIHALSLRLLTPEEWRKGGAETFQTPNCQSK